MSFLPAPWTMLDDINDLATLPGFARSHATLSLGAGKALLCEQNGLRIVPRHPV